MFSEKDTFSNYEPISGILILKDNKTYGKYKNKYYYLCIPNNKLLPSFLIPYEIKSVGFSKIYTNLFITFQFKKWEKNIPQGILLQVIGPVNENINFYEYQLYCNYLNKSQKKIDNTFIKLGENNIQKQNPNIIDKTHLYVFTIDPLNCLDFDDAFSVVKIENTINLSIYISNVPLWLNAINYWENMQNSTHVSTIYLPHKKQNMLPSLLSDNLCSLSENNIRYAFEFNLQMVVYDNKIIKIINTSFTETKIQVKKNYVYEEKSLLKHKDYKLLYDTVKMLSSSQDNKIMDIYDSHDVVAYLMILMNSFVAKFLAENNTGIFRGSLQKQQDTQKQDTQQQDTQQQDTQQQDTQQQQQSQIQIIPKPIENFIKCWKNTSIIKYTLCETAHDFLRLSHYVHITSPIRRIIDILNMIIMRNILWNNTSQGEKQFLEKSINEENIKYINETMNKIKKVQHQCELLEKCTHNPELYEKIMDAYVIESIIENTYLQLQKYIIYIVDLKIISTIKTKQILEQHTKISVKLFLFENEHNYTKKIRFQLQ
jgi:exoribonuclease R